MFSWRSYAAVSTVALVVALGLGTTRDDGGFSVDAILADIIGNPVKIVLTGNFVAVVCGWIFFAASGALYGTLSADEQLLLQEKALNCVLLKLVFSAALLAVRFDVEALLWACWVGVVIVLEQLSALGRRRLDALELHGSGLQGLPPKQSTAVAMGSTGILVVAGTLSYLCMDLLGPTKPLVAQYLLLDCAHPGALAAHSLLRLLMGSSLAPSAAGGAILGLDATVDASTLALGLLQDWLALRLGLQERGVGLLHAGLLWLALGRAWAMARKVADYSRHAKMLAALPGSEAGWRVLSAGEAAGGRCGVSQVELVGGEGDEQAVQAPCGHVFRLGTLRRWAMTRATGGQCPVCGASLLAAGAEPAVGAVDRSGGQVQVQDAEDGPSGQWPEGVRMPPADAGLGHADSVVLRFDAGPAAGMRPEQAGGAAGVGRAGGVAGAVGLAAGAGAGFLGLPSLSLSVVTGGAFGLRADVGRPLRGGDVPAVLGRGMGGEGADPLARNTQSVLEVAPHVQEQAVQERLRAGASVGAVVEEALAGRLPGASAAELAERRRGAGDDAGGVGGAAGAGGSPAEGASPGGAPAGGGLGSGWPESLAEARGALTAPLPGRKGALGGGEDARTEWLLRRARARFAVRAARAAGKAGGK